MWKKAKALIFPSLGVLLFGAALAVGIQPRIEKLQRSYDTYATPPLAMVNPSSINIFLLGHKAIYDDYISIFLLQSLMETGIAKEAGPLMNQIRSVIKHHPKLETTYLLSCFVMLRQLNHPENCREISEAGLIAFPASWRISMTQAFVEYSAMNHPAQAASFFMMAATRENAPEYVKKAAKKLLETRELTDDDIEKSLEVISRTEGKGQFLDMLSEIKKSKKPAAVSP